MIKKNFSDLHDDIIKRSNALANVKQRALNLIANSKALYLSALSKITQVEGKVNVTFKVQTSQCIA